ncbi:MAG: hypothetical protein ATN31_07420 [Candidatus Epulonipiscioides saccharophilum]|nr:MAG: hypothetical protein ATN31_07420 [Epulopiscium sp. AS2M-Bin001]
MSKREMDKIVNQIVKDAKEKLTVTQQEKENKCGLIILSITVIAGLIAIVLYIKSKQDEDIEEYYEYFDDDDDDDMYEDLSDDDDDDVEYLEIKNFEEEDLEREDKDDK